MHILISKRTKRISCISSKFRNHNPLIVTIIPCSHIRLRKEWLVSLLVTKIKLLAISQPFNTMCLIRIMIECLFLQFNLQLNNQTHTKQYVNTDILKGDASTIKTTSIYSRFDFQQSMIAFSLQQYHKYDIKMKFIFLVKAESCSAYFLR